MPGNYTVPKRAPSPAKLTAVMYNSDHQLHVDNNTPDGVDDASLDLTQMRSTVDPGEQGSESLATSLMGELQRLRHAIQEIKGSTFWYETPAATLANAASRGYLFGLTLATSLGDTANDVSIGAGECSSDDAIGRVLLGPPPMTKQLDVVWASGSNAGGRIAAEALADGTWHVFVFRRSGGADDFCFSQTLAPTLPDGGTHKRRIGSFIRISGANKPFVQDADYFVFKSPILDINVTNPGTLGTLRTLSVPAGVNVISILNVGIGNSGVPGTSVALYLSDPDQNDDAGNALPANTFVSNSDGSNMIAGWVYVRTNTSRQIRSRSQVTSANVNLRLATAGWLDTRGRLA